MSLQEIKKLFPMLKCPEARKKKKKKAQKVQEIQCSQRTREGFQRQGCALWVWFVSVCGVVLVLAVWAFL